MALATKETVLACQGKFLIKLKKIPFPGASLERPATRSRPKPTNAAGMYCFDNQRGMAPDERRQFRGFESVAPFWPFKFSSNNLAPFPAWDFTIPLNAIDVIPFVIWCGPFP